MTPFFFYSANIESNVNTSKDYCEPFNSWGPFQDESVAGRRDVLYSSWTVCRVEKETTRCEQLAKATPQEIPKLLPQVHIVAMRS